MTASGRSQLIVVADDTVELVAEIQRTGEVQRIDASQGRRVDIDGTLEQLRPQRQQIDRIEHGTGSLHPPRSCTPHGAQQLRPHQVARHDLAVVAVHPGGQCARLDLPHHQLHRR